jgi:hypothetical protein
MDVSYQDERGYLWELNPFTLQLDVMDNGTSPTIYMWYATTNCTGPAYFQTNGLNLFPRIVFRVDGDPTNRSIPDSPTIVAVTVQSIKGSASGTCQPFTSSSVLAIPVAETGPADPIVVPTLNYTPPIHPE